jgi:hypothetical protein
MLWLVAAKSLRRFVSLEEFENLFSEAIPLLGVQLTMAIGMSLGAGATLAIYFRWRSRVLKNKNLRQSDPPRLIVHHGLQLTMALCTLIGVSVVATISLLQLSGLSYEQIWAGPALVEANKYAVAVLIPAGFVTFMIFPHIRPVLDIVLDVMNHFYFRATEVHDAIHSDEFDIMESTLESGTLYFSRRDAIHLRVKKTLAYFRDKLETRPKLTLISHSQGTMIAIEVLNDPELAWLSASFSEVRLVTMGSPFAHLYQHYFKHLYPHLEDSHWDCLNSRLDRWVNIYRQDDFVGTRIDFREKYIHTEGKFTNHPVGLRGHLNYWSDREVLQILHQKLAGAESSERLSGKRAA